MHTLNFCQDLCLPIKGVNGSRGLNIIKEFPEGVVIPMAGIATPYHALYVSRPVKVHVGGNESIILRTGDLDTEQKVRDVLSDPNYLVVAPDSALDSDEMADAVFRTRDQSLGRNTKIWLW